MKKFAVHTVLFTAFVFASTLLRAEAISPELNQVSRLTRIARLLKVSKQSRNFEEGPAAPAQPTPGPGAPVQPAPEYPACTETFVNSYVQTANELKVVAAYVKAGETVPNLTEAVMACSMMQRDFPDMTCTATAVRVTASTDDFTDVCRAVVSLYKQATGLDEVPGPVAPSDVTDATPILRLEANRLKMTVQSASELQRAFEHPRVLSIIRGRVLDVAGALNVDDDVRCLIAREGNATAPKLQQGESLRIARVSESYSGQYRTASFSLEGSKFSVVCLSDTGSGLKLGELKTALGAIIKVDYQK